MRSINNFVALFFLTIFAAIFVLDAAGFFPSRSVTQPDPQSDVRYRGVRRVGDQDNALVSLTPEAIKSQKTPMQDGLALLKTHCIRCHNTAWFDKIETPRSEWEQALAQMEAMGVHLSDAEKFVLLDYLTAADKP